MQYKLGKTALLSVMKTLQDALLEGKDASQGLRDLRFTSADTTEIEGISPVVVLEVKKD